VVDVGGGVGSTTLQLMKAYPHLRYLVQDRPNVIADGIKVRLSRQRGQVYEHKLIRLTAQVLGE
jgi:O-methyltransferase domain